VFKINKNEESLERYRSENNSRYRLNKSNSVENISINNSLSFKNNSFNQKYSNVSNIDDSSPKKKHNDIRKDNSKCLLGDNKYIKAS